MVSVSSRSGGDTAPRSAGPAGGRRGRRLDVLDVLRSATAPLSIVAIAGELGVHPNTVRLHLEALVREGRVEQVEPDRRGPGRPPLLFRAIGGMDPAGPRQYRLLAEILTENLARGPDPADRAVSAGRAWGDQLAQTRSAEPAAPTERLVALLEELGFAPEYHAGGRGGQIDLRSCPFLEIAEHRAQVVCPVHLGLMRGALSAWDAPVTVDRLEAFAEPDRCIAHLARAKARSAP
jgi:predicted ArsR family transcriptional regulator